MVTESQIVEEYLSGLSSYKIAAKHALSHHFVCRTLKRNNVKARTKKEASALYHGKSEVLNNEQVTRDYKSGMTLVQVAKKNNCNVKTVQYILDLCDVKRRTQVQSSDIRFNRKEPLDYEQIVRDYEEMGYSMQKVAEKHGCNRSTVYRTVNRRKS